jgi:hypothetical protein
MKLNAALYNKNKTFGVKTMKKLFYPLFIFIFLFLLPSCGDDNPVPTLTSISPLYSVARMPGFTLHATGTGFISESKIIFNGIEKDTSYISSTEITCSISAAELIALSANKQTTGTNSEINLGDSNVNVHVENPTPGGGQSGNLSFQITSNHVFAASKNISQTDTDSTSPQIAVDSSGNVNAVWCETQQDPYNYEIYMRRSTDSGTNWSSQINVSETDDYSSNPAIAVDTSNNINVVWEEWVPDTTQFDIYFRRSTDSGSSWGAKINISNTVWTSSKPTMVIHQAGTIFIAWLERTYIAGVDKQEIHSSYSTDNGLTWAASTKISETYCDSPIRLAISNMGILAVVWRSGECSDKGDIYVSVSGNQGIQWGTPVNISNTATVDSTTPDIAFDNTGAILVTWRDEAAGNTEILLTKSLDYGLTWTSPVNISNTSGFSRASSIKVDSVGNFNCIWMDKTAGNYEIFYSRSTDNGITWSSSVNVSNTTAESENPKLGLNSMGYLFILWIDKTSGKPDIYFNRSKISGID